MCHIMTMMGRNKEQESTLSKCTSLEIGLMEKVTGQFPNGSYR